MPDKNIQVNLTFTQQLTVSRLNTQLASLKIKRDEILQELTEFIQLCTLELGIPRGAAFDQKLMAFLIPQTQDEPPSKS